MSYNTGFLLKTKVGDKKQYTLYHLADKDDLAPLFFGAVVFENTAAKIGKLNANKAGAEKGFKVFEYTEDNSTDEVKQALARTHLSWTQVATHADTFKQTISDLEQLRLEALTQDPRQAPLAGIKEWRLSEDKVNEVLAQIDFNQTSIIFAILQSSVFKGTDVVLILPVDKGQEEQALSNLKAHYAEQVKQAQALIQNRSWLCETAPAYACRNMMAKLKALNPKQLKLGVLGAVVASLGVCFAGYAYTQQAKEPQDAQSSLQAGNNGKGDNPIVNQLRGDKVSDEEVQQILGQIDFKPSKTDENGKPIFDEEYYDGIVKQTIAIGLKNAGVDLEAQQGLQCLQPHSGS